MTRVRIVKNELGGSATQQELRGWRGHNGINNSNPEYDTMTDQCIEDIVRRDLDGSLDP